MTGTHQVLHQDDAAAELPLDRSPSKYLVRYTATFAINDRPITKPRSARVLMKADHQGFFPCSWESPARMFPPA
ncbi:hypothetical protein ACH4MT_32505 [Streptomyces anulatus]